MRVSHSGYKEKALLNLSSQINTLILSLLIVLINFTTNAIPRDTGIVYINGIQNSKLDASKSAIKTDRLLGLSIGTVKPIYNQSESFLSDLLETYELLAREGQIKSSDTGTFWRWIRNPATAPEVWRSIFFKKAIDLPKSVDLVKMKSRLDGVRRNERIVVVAHSEGNLVANALIKEITIKDKVLGKECTSMVSIATPTLEVANNGPYTTSENDLVINTARLGMPFGFEILKSNINVPVTLKDVTGHNYTKTYLTNSIAKNKIKSDIDNVATKLQSSCKSVTCGTPTSANGRYSPSTQRFTYSIPANVGNKPQDIKFSFEAYNIPDSMVAKAKGNTLFSTGGLKSGYFEKTVKFDPIHHGNKVDISVDAPDTNTAWRMCISCPQIGRQCSEVNMKRVKVRASLFPGDPWWKCANLNGVYIDGVKNILNRAEDITEGDHVLTWTGGACNCTNLVACPTARQPELSIGITDPRGRIKSINIPLGFRSGGSADITITVTP